MRKRIMNNYPFIAIKKRKGDSRQHCPTPVFALKDSVNVRLFFDVFLTQKRFNILHLYIANQFQYLSTVMEAVPPYEC